MKADELIAALAAEGELDSSGAFTLDPAVALDKLREFQLGDPTRFVLSWVRAANVLGATRIDVEADADDVWVRFDGEPLTANELGLLWSSVVGQRGSARQRACRELALGINGAFAWQAKSVSVCSGEHAVSIDRSFEISAAEATPSATTTVLHAKRPLGWDLVRRRLLDARGELPEELHLARSCARGRVPVYLEGRRLEARVEDSDWSLHRVEIDAQGRRGWLRLRRGRTSQLRVLIAGVEVTTLQLSYGSGMIDALIDDPLLPLDLSQERVVEAERWQLLLASVSRARWQMWFELAAERGWPSAADDEAPRVFTFARRALIDEIFASPDRSWTEVPGAMAFADKLELPRAVTRPLGDVESLDGSPVTTPLWPWPLAEPRPLMLGELVRCALAERPLFCSPVPRDDLAYVGELPVVLHGSSLGLRALGHVVLDRPAIVDRYRKAVAEHRPGSGQRALPPDWLELRDRFELPEFALAVRVAWQRGAAEGVAGTLSLVGAGQCFARYQLPVRWGPLWAEVELPFVIEHGPDFERVLAICVLAALARHHDLLAALDGAQLLASERALIVAYLREAYGRWSAGQLAELRLSAHARREAIAVWPGPWGVPAEWSMPSVDAAPVERGVPNHAVAELAWLEQGRRQLSLRDIQRELAIGGALVWVAPFETEPTPPEVWRLGPAQRAIIADVFRGSLTPFDHHAWRRRAPGSSQVPAQLPEARASTRLAGAAGEHGLLSLADTTVPRAWGRAPRRGARMQLLCRGHALGWMDVPLPIGSFFGVIEVPEARAAPHADLAVKDAAWLAAAALVESAALRVAENLLAAWRGGEHQLGDRQRVFDWQLDLDGGAWPSFAAALSEWHASLPPTDPLHVELDTRDTRP